MPQLSDGEAKVWRQVFDFWRESYDEWPYSSHQRFYNMVAKAFPEQKKYDRERVIDALTHALAARGEPLRVWELGGWGGALAKEMFYACSDGILEWRNFEICPDVVCRAGPLYGGTDIPGKGLYFPVCPQDWVWQLVDLARDWDIAILSHVIEHLSWDHLQSLLVMLRNVPFLYIQTPDSMGMKPHPTGWVGTMSTHKLEVGWNEVYGLLSQLGYKELWHKDQSRFFAKQTGEA